MLTAADVMTTDVVTVSPETTARDIAILLHSKRISGAQSSMRLDTEPCQLDAGKACEVGNVGRMIGGQPKRSDLLRCGSLPYCPSDARASCFGIEQDRTHTVEVED